MNSFDENSIQLASRTDHSDLSFWLIQRTIDWYRRNHRDLPWRLSPEPYRIWLAEVMSQQTTMTALIPYYERFVESFPTLESLAQAEESQVMRMWAGLGYYSRARNLLKAAQLIQKVENFPQTTQQLQKLPGFGPYIARAVASQAFGEPVGVLDGNVIRVISRFFAYEAPWWQAAIRKRLQQTVDQMAQISGHPSHFNQGLMELGALVCRPVRPLCGECPLKSHCRSQPNRAWTKIPIQKPRPVLDLWQWDFYVLKQKNSIALVPNRTGRLLKTHWTLPNTLKLLRQPKSRYDFIHRITKHQLYCSVYEVSRLKDLPTTTDHQWVETRDVKALFPSSVLNKIFKSLGYEI